MESGNKQVSKYRFLSTFVMMAFQPSKLPVRGGFSSQRQCVCVCYLALLDQVVHFVSQSLSE